MAGEPQRRADCRFAKYWHGRAHWHRGVIL